MREWNNKKSTEKIQETLFKICDILYELLIKT